MSAAVPACSDSGSGTGAESDGDGWSFKDDRGRAVKADARPERIVAYVGSAAALHDYGVDCTAVFGPATYSDGRRTPQAGSLDVKKLDSVGVQAGTFNIEKFASLRPDLLVSNMNQPKRLWQVPDEGADKIESLAPSVAITTSGVSLLHPIQRYAALAEALGADLKAPRVAEAERRFETAAERLRRVAGAKKDLKVLAVATQAENLYVGAPGMFPDTRYFDELGVGFVHPEKPAAPGFWELVSWENADLYPADVIFADQRSNNLPLKEVAKTKGTWNRLPAVRAGQVVPWNNEAQFSYAGYAPLVERLADALEKARKVT